MEEGKKTHKTERRRRDADDRKTVKSVLDKKTLEIIEKLLKQGLLIEMHGAVCVGKEACIYLATAASSIYSRMCRKIPNESTTVIPVAIKIYKTSTMMFKDRERYITGERRFKHYAKRNSRKLVKLWAEKEVRNLNRLQKAGIPSPQPLFLRRNILIMSMIGNQEDGTSKEGKVKKDSGVSSKVLEFDVGDDESFDESDLNDKGSESCSSDTRRNVTESMSYTSDEEECIYQISEDESSDNGLNNISISTTSESSPHPFEGASDVDSAKACNDSPTYNTQDSNRRAHTSHVLSEEPETSSEDEDSLQDSESSDDSDFFDEAEGIERMSILESKERSDMVEREGGLGGIAPNLKQAVLHESEVQDVYDQTVLLIKRMYKDCGLVHADLSEYNMLYWKGVVHIIDVSQSVERDHPNAQIFLEMDIKNVNNYFTRLGAQTKSNAELLKEVTSQEVLSKDAYSMDGDSADENRETESCSSSSVLEEETKKDRKEKKKEVKEERRRQRENKISKKEKKLLSRKAKARVLKERNNKFN
ncbi:RIO kinase 1 [Nematocida minor]|uniref:RIO kinase 1 n=1 Tax=Nematocida minor TaxID=1912983 RepID=UPI00221F95FB|nr:RIO kinase 1 [Nematocida minor]KAI5191780.1 RIO kinase 1 [Nematocida minor]